MRKQKHNAIHPQKRYGRRSTKARAPFRPPTHPERWIAGAVAGIAVIVLALVWGNVLKTKSDAYRADKEAGIWTLPPESVVGTPTAPPDSHLLEIKPEGNVGDIVMYRTHDGVLLPLRDATGTLYYRSETGLEAGLAIPSDAIPLAKDIERLDKRPLYSAGIYHVTCFLTADPATATYRRGLDLALLCEYAASGIDELLLLGLPAGDEVSDAQSVAFLCELYELLATLPSPPAIGVALPLSAFEDDADTSSRASSDTETTNITVLSGALSPGRIGRVCDYLALDMRNRTQADMDALLPRLGYIYQRHHLRMLVNREAVGISEDLLSHGFGRVYEMRAED